jgi:hypothetical protein
MVDVKRQSDEQRGMAQLEKKSMIMAHREQLPEAAELAVVNAKVVAPLRAR